MKSYVLLLTMGLICAGQTTNPLSNVVQGCDREGDKNCVDVLSLTKDVHGCNPWSGFIWDEKSKTCQVTGTIHNTTGELLAKCKVSLMRDVDGNQTITCWYVPTPPKEKK